MRSNGFQITGNELQAMVTERILGAKTAIPATTRCLTRAEVLSCVYDYAGPQDPPVAAIPFTTWPLGGGLYQVGADPNLTCSYEYINPLPANGTIVFEMNQVGSPYLNCDLFAQVNGSPLRLDPGSNLDGMFFGGPQYSPNMASAVRIGNLISIQANFGLNNAETPGNFGWNGNGYGVLEVYRNSVLISNQSTAYRTASYSANATQLTSSIIVESGVSYYVKAYPVEDNRVRATVKYATSFCSVCNDETGTQNVIGNASTFCASTSFTSSGFASLAAGNYVLAYGGNALNVSTNGTTTATMYGGGCTACLSTTATWTYVYQNCLSCVTRNIYQDTNSCSATYGQYKINPDGTAQVGAPTNTGACDTTPTWTDNGTVISLNCVNYTVYKNTNSCSSTYNFYRYTNDALSATVTQESDPSTTASSLHKNWVFQYYNCASCVTRSVERDMNPCSDTYLGYTVTHGVYVGTVAPANTGECSGCCGQSTTQVWTYTGEVRCTSSCVSQREQKQTNPCATQFESLRWVNGGSNCSTTADWTIAFSSYSCLDCAKYYNEIDLNSCSPTSGQLRRSSVLIDAVTTYCGACCGQSATPDWTIAFSSYSCGGTTGCDKYYNEIDLNSCSPTSGNVRISSLLAESNSSYCCTPVNNCIRYQIIDYGWVSYTDCLDHEIYEYHYPNDTICATSIWSGYGYQLGNCDGEVPQP
jgi:hypothetical protein